MVSAMLHDFLITERDAILALCKEKLLDVSASRSSSEEMDISLPVFYDEFVEVLRLDEIEGPEIEKHVSEAIHRDSAVRRGKESLKLGYTISQEVF